MDKVCGVRIKISHGETVIIERLSGAFFVSDKTCIFLLLLGPTDISPSMEIDRTPSVKQRKIMDLDGKHINSKLPR